MLIAFTILFTLRPFAIGPVWSIVLVYLIFPILFTFNLNIDRKPTIYVYGFFSIFAIGNMIGNAYATYTNVEINIVSELLFLIGSFALILYILFSFKKDAIRRNEDASFTNHYLENILSVAPIMMYALDTNYRYKMVNSAYLEGTGYNTTDEVVGKTKKEIFNDERYEKIDLSLDEDTNLIQGIKKKYSSTRKLFLSYSKTEKWVAYSKVATKDKNGKISGILCVMNDVTDIFDNQKELDIKNEELQKYIDSNLQLESFAFLASHDLKTPLRSISSFSQLLKNKVDSKLSDEEKEYLNYIIEGSNSMNNLIADLLEYSILNKAEFTISKFEISRLVNAVTQDLNIAIVKENATVELIDNEVKYISGEFLLLKQLLNNLITNAIKYRKENVNPIIQIICSEKDENILIEVKDNGIGIEDTYFNKIFLLLQRLHTSNTYEGTGIGLAICKQIVEKHSGKLWVESTLGEGSSFYFTIPSTSS